MRGAALTGSYCGKAKHRQGGLAGVAGRARAPSPRCRALAEREGAFLLRAAHGADKSPASPACTQGASPIPPSTMFARAARESIRPSRGTQYPESHGERAAPLPPSAFPVGQPGPNTLPKNRRLPLLVPADLATGPPRNLGRDSLHPWVPTPLPAGSPSLPDHPAHPKPSLIPPEFLTAPSLGWAGGTGLTSGRGSCAEGQWLAGQQQQQCGNATSGTHGVPRGWSSGSGSGHGTASAGACFQARAAATTIFNKVE